MLTINYLFIILLLQSSSTNGFRILGVFLYPSQSHEVLGTALLTELADRGHEVTMISTFTKNSLSKNFTHVFVNSTDIRNQFSKYLPSNLSIWDQTVFSTSKMKQLISALLEDSKLQAFLDSGKQFDVTISDLFGEALLGISHHVNASTIAFYPFGEGKSTLEYLSGNPQPYAYIPHASTGYSNEMTFWQRLGNCYMHVFNALLKQLFNIPMQKSILKQYFPNAPPLEELVAKIHVHLLNTHYLFEAPRPYFPNVIPIGGFHLQNAEKLTVDLLKHLDAQKNGVILVAFGGHTTLGNYPMDTIEVLLGGFARSQFSYIVQYVGPKIVNCPRNVRLMEWVPQRAVLSHQNTKAFVTHGGRSSVAEAIYFGVPMVRLTVSIDNNCVIDSITAQGFSVQLDLDGLTKEEVISTMKDVVGNPVYKQEILNESRLYRRQEMNPLDKAIYWVEYVAKNNGANRVKSNIAASIPLYQYLLLDVLFLTLLMTIVMAVVSYYWSRWIFKTFVKKSYVDLLKHKSV